MTSTSKQAARRKARVKALQALYQWDLNLEAGNNPDAPAIRRQFIDTQDMQGIDQECFDNLLLGSIDVLPELDKSLEVVLDSVPCADWGLTSSLIGSMYHSGWLLMSG